VRIEEVVGHNIQARRKAMGWTQEELGRQLGELLGREWPRQTVFSAEKGDRGFTASELLALAVTLQTSVQRLFRVPLGIDTVMVAPGHSIEAQALDAFGAVADDPAAEVARLKQLIGSLYNFNRSRGHQVTREEEFLQTAESVVENLEQALRASGAGDGGDQT
jgi:transcriptional regulator with XRE-family HTH domain